MYRINNMLVGRAIGAVRRWLQNQGVIILTLLGCLSFPVELLAHQGEERAPESSILVDTAWLADNRENSDVVIIDARPPGDYRHGHIAGAINLPPASSYHSKLDKRVVSQAGIQNVLGSLGIQSDGHIVIYGSALYMDAARTFWVLELYGHDRVSFLSGGYAAWRREGLPVNADIPTPVPVGYLAVIRPGRMATKLQMLLAIDDPAVGIIDTREAVEYQGVESTASRSGHIPTAGSIPKNNNLEVRNGIFYIKSLSSLEDLYQGVDEFSRVILYCNGVRESSITYMALRLLGRKVSVYDGGWREWGNNPGLPIVTSVQ